MITLFGERLFQAEHPAIPPGAGFEVGDGQRHVMHPGRLVHPVIMATKRTREASARLRSGWR
jgi:hypothetical protein